MGADLVLLNAQREPLNRKALVELVGEERVTESAEVHRERVRTSVFGLSGDSGRDRYLGLLQLMHTLRSPDVGNRIDEGQLPQILSDALPPLNEPTLSRAGEQLDGLTTTRAALARLEQSHASVRRLLGVYGRYAASTVLETANATLGSVQDLDAARLTQSQRRATHDRLRAEHARRAAEEEQLGNDVAELQNAINGIRGRAIFKQANDLMQRDRAVAAFADATDKALEEAERERTHHASAVRGADRRLDEVREAVAAAARALTTAGRSLDSAGLASTVLPDQIRLADQHVNTQDSVIRRRRDLPPVAVERPVPSRVTIWPGDLAASEPGLHSVIEAAKRRHELARLRLLEARRLAVEEIAVRACETDALRAREQSDLDIGQAQRDADRRDHVAVEFATSWRTWSVDATTADLLGDVDFAADEVLAPLLIDVETLIGDAGAGAEGSPNLNAYDATADRLARPVRMRTAEARAELASAQRADDAVRAVLRAEAAALSRAEDPAPPHAP